MKDSIYILDARRTAIASPMKALKEFSAAQLAAAVVNGLTSSRPDLAAAVDEVIFGNVVAAGTGQNLARQIVKLAGLPIATPAYVVNSVCGSGLQAVILAARTIICGEAKMILAGGAESATHAPYLIFGNGGQLDVESVIESGYYDGLRCAETGRSMGELCEALAGKAGISREEQDRFASLSHQKACTARDAGLFKDEIVPVKTEKGVFAEDQRPRRQMDDKRMDSLPPAFAQQGTITPGNASSPADAACSLWLASADFVEKNKLKPMARLLGYVHFALEPQDTFTGAVGATQKLLKETGLTVKDVGLFEIVESFAAQAIYTQRELHIPSEKLNVFGGDIALGHPLGMAGARALVTLVHALRQTRKKIGVVSVCFGGGGAIALAVESIS